MQRTLYPGRRSVVPGPTCGRAPLGAMAYLRIFMGETLLEQRELTAERTTIGRTGDNDIVLKGRGVSKHHAVIERHGDHFVFIDDGSVNGSFIRGRRILRQDLKYWDEVQIFNYVLKFMAVARARGEESGSPEWDGRRQEQDETMELDISTLGDLAKLKRRVNIASVTLGDGTDAAYRYALDKVNFSIGTARNSDIGIGGWLAPRVAARIQRRNDGFYLLPTRRGRVRLNDERVSHASRLEDGDRLSVRGVALQFHFGPQDRG